MPSWVGGKGTTHPLPAAGTANWYHCCGSQCTGSSKGRSVSTMQSHYIFWAIYPKGSVSHDRENCLIMFIAVLFRTTRTRKQLRCSAADVCRMKMWHIYVLEYSSAVKKNEIMTSETKRMGLETTTLSDAIQAQKVKYITNFLSLEERKLSLFSAVYSIWNIDRSQKMSKKAWWRRFQGKCNRTQ